MPELWTLAVSAPMRIRTVQIIIASLALLIYGCSKRTPPAAWSSSESVIVEPGVAIGPVHSGMTIRQVMTDLGRPNNGVVPTPPDEGCLVYTNIGLGVWFDSGGRIVSVSVGQPFAGHTKEGIGLGASRADVIKEYGEPTATNTLPNSSFELLRYEQRGIRFSLHDGKIDEIVVAFKPKK